MVFQDALSALNPYYSVGWQVAEAYRLHHDVSKKGAHRRAGIVALRGTEAGHGVERVARAREREAHRLREDRVQEEELEQPDRLDPQ